MYFIRGILYEDYSFVFQSLVYARRIGILRDCYYYYRYTAGSITNVVKEKDKDMLKTVRFLEDFCDKVAPSLKLEYFFMKNTYSWVCGGICFKYPSRFPFSKEANAIVRSVLYDPIFKRYVSYFAYGKNVPLRYKIPSWLSLNSYPLYVLVLWLNHNIKKLLKMKMF